MRKWLVLMIAAIAAVATPVLAADVHVNVTIGDPATTVRSTSTVIRRRDLSMPSR